jgi:hypothetical protein
MTINDNVQACIELKYNIDRFFPPIASKEIFNHKYIIIALIFIVSMS